MSGAMFVAALERVGYAGANDLESGSFDWIFEYDSVVPFLEWFCDEIQASNRLDPKDIVEFSVLEQSTDVLLEGEQLEETLRSLSSGQEEQLSDDKLRDEIYELEKELEGCQHRKELLIQQRNKISSHKSSLGDRLLRVANAETSAKNTHKQNLEQSQADNTKMNLALEDVKSAVFDLSALYLNRGCEGKQEEMEQGRAVFLSQLPLDSWFQKEERFTTELTAFTKKQFQGLAEIAGQDEGSRYELLEISNPDSLLVAGEKESTVFDACKEIARLQLSTPRSESMYIDALVEEKCVKAACDFLEQKQKQIKEKPYPNDSSLNNRLKDLQNTLAVLRHDLAALAEQEVPSLVKDSATLQVTRILQGNYDLKIARQDYFMSNQDQVIDLLVMQRARNEFMTMAFELEAKGHRCTHRLLTALNMLLHNMHMSQAARMEMLKDPTLTNNRMQRSTLDSRDKFFTKIHHILDPDSFSGQSQLFVTYSQLAENADRLNHHVASLRASASTADNSQDNKLNALERTLRTCESSLYSGSSTVGGQPVLSPQPIADTMTQLDAMLKKLEVAVMDIMKDVDQKKKHLQSDPLLALERELFVHFFNDPDRLRRVVGEISQKLDARLVK